MKKNFVVVILALSVFLFNPHQSLAVSAEEIRADFVSYLLAVFLEERGVLAKGFLQNMIRANFIVGLDMKNIYLKEHIREPYYYIFLQFCDCFFPFYSFEKKDFLITNEEAINLLKKVVKKILLIAKSGNDTDVANYLSKLKQKTEKFISL